MKTAITVKGVEISFKPCEGEKLKSTTEYFLFHIFETLKSEDASWTTSTPQEPLLRLLRS
jgi:hypothetical protein